MRTLNQHFTADPQVLNTQHQTCLFLYSVALSLAGMVSSMKCYCWATQLNLQLRLFLILLITLCIFIFLYWTLKIDKGRKTFRLESIGNRHKSFSSLGKGFLYSKISCEKVNIYLNSAQSILISADFLRGIYCFSSLSLPGLCSSSSYLASVALQRPALERTYTTVKLIHVFWR